MKRITAIIVTICMVVTGTFTGLPQLLTEDQGIEASAASYPSLKTIKYKATGNQRNDIIGFAKTQVGYREGSGNNTYFGSWFGCNYNPWCAMFVCWCASKAGVSKSVIPRIATADRSWAKKQGVYHKSKYWGGSYTPKKGDLIYFSWSVRDWADHIGMVTGTGKSGGTTYVYTVEGNKHDKVIEGSYPINNRYILGYTSPKYTTGDPPEETTTTKASTDKTYTLKYRDGLDITSNDEEDEILPPVKGTFGKDLKLANAKFTRKGYSYSAWDVYRENSNGNLIYLCRDDATGQTEKWYRPNKIPDTYTQVTVPCESTINISRSVSGTIYVSPVWETAKYAVTYNANGGEGAPEEQTKIYGKSLKLSTQTPTRIGYTFQGWAKSASETKAVYDAGDTYKSNKKLSLYAVWKMEPYDVIATEGLNTRSGPGTSYKKVSTLDAGTKVTVMEVKDNWGKMSDGTWISLDYTASADITSYTLEYVDGVAATADDSAVISPIDVKYGEQVITAPAEFAREGHHYTKWKVFREASFGRLYLCRDKATGKKERWLLKSDIPSKYEMVTITAGKKLLIRNIVGERIYITPDWHLDTYRITYKANGGKGAPTKQTKKYGKTLTLRKSVPKRSGYKFLGWATSAKATKAQYKASGKYTKNQRATLYAVWKSASYKVKTTDEVNKRKGPGTDYDVIGVLPEGKTVSIVKVKNGWGKLKNGGWISMSLTKDVSGSASAVKSKGSKSSKSKKDSSSSKKQEKQTAASSAKVFVVKVTASDGVNARTGPSKSKEIAASYEKGKTLKVRSVKNGWGQLKSGGNWILLKYTKITSGYKVSISSDDLNQRTGPGTQYSIKGTIEPGKYNIVKINGDWGKVKQTGYWVYLAYTKRVK